MGKHRDQARASLRAALRRRKQRPLVSEQQPLPLWPEKVEGGRLVRELERYVQSLRAEEAHGNRELFLDDVFLAYLLAFFNPTLRSLRTIEDFSQTRQAQRHLSTRRICKSTLSDFNKLADPTRLEPILAALRSALRRKNAGQGRPDLQGLVKQVLAVDGTFFAAAADVAWAIGHRNQTATSRYRARLDVQLNISTWLPEVISVPEPGEGEAHSASQFVQPGAIHIYDRGYGSFELLAAHYELQEGDWQPRAEFVLRAKSHQLSFTATQERPLSDEQRQRGMVSDRVGQLTGSQGNRAPPFAVREILFVKEDGETVRLLTNLLEVSAEAVAELYRQRWQIELFFRWLKCYAHFDHLISHSRSGVLLNFYVVVIGVLLMYLHTGGRPSKYALVLLGMVAQSGGSLDSILPILRERERQCERDRKSAALRRARKKAAAQ
jgi:Transposase DDE domain